MKICLVTQQYREIKSGVGVYATIMVDNLSSCGYKVTVIMPPSRVRRENVGFVFAPPSRFDPTPNKWLSFSYNAARRFKQLNEHFDVVHFTDAKEALFFPFGEVPMVGNVNDCYLAMASKNPLYYRKFYPADWIKRYFYYNLARILEKRALSRLKKLISNSRFVSAELGKLYDIHQDKFSVIHKSIDLARFKAHLRDKKEKRSVILLVGGNFQRKGLPLLIKAAPLILEQYPSAQFYAIGNDPNVHKMIKLCRKEGVDKAFRFLGQVSNEAIGDYYRLADVLVMPSLVEAFGVVFLEAMASGTPVIGSKVGGTKDLIEHDKNGFLVDPSNSDELADYVLRLLNDDELRARIIGEGYKTVRNHNMNRMLDETVEFYDKLLGIQFNNSS